MTRLTLTHEDLLGNDIGTGIKIIAVTPSELGGFVRLGDETVEYTVPKTSQYDRVQDRFQYTIRDKYRQQSTANVAITLSSVVAAVDDTIDEIPCGTSKTVPTSTILANDGGVDLVVSSIGRPAEGTAILNGGFIEYTAPGCTPAVAEKEIVALQRYATGGLDTTPSLTTDKVNVNTLQVGDLIVLTAFAAGSAQIEEGWTILASSPGAKMYYRIADSAYVGVHKAINGPYPYYTDTTGAGVRPLVRVMSFHPLSKSADQTDFFLDYYAASATGSFVFTRPAITNADYYRNNYVLAYGVSGENDTSGPPPLEVTDTIADRLQVRSWEQNRFTMYAEGDAPASIYYSERSSISNASTIYAASFALREVPAVVGLTETDTIPYTARDKYGVTGTAKITIPIKHPVRTTVDRYRQSGYLANENGFCSVGEALQDGNFMIGIFIKTTENTTGPGNPENLEFPARGINPSDPLPGWTVVAKSGPHANFATTVAYRRVDAAYRQANGSFTISAFPAHRDFAGTTTFTGIEVWANPDEDWNEIFVSAISEAITAPTYSPVPAYVPADGVCITHTVARTDTSTILYSGGDTQLKYQNRDNFRRRNAVITFATNRTVINALDMDIGGSFSAIALRKRVQ